MATLTTKGAHVLIVDDEHEVRAILRSALEREGFAVTEAADGDQALESIRSRAPSLIILDLGLPTTPGIDLLRELRSSGSIPVIVVTGRGDEIDRVLGLELGADDYVTKPFSPREVAARVKSVLRRTEPDQPVDLLRFGEWTIDLAAREVRRGEVAATLTSREFDLLAFLARHPRRVFSPDQLLREIWATEPGWQSAKTVGEHVYRVRHKVEPDPTHPRWIVTVRGAGYRFDP
ncbi:MAG: response regulator transcription factor [Acidimicrobiales bacterium]